MKKLMIAILALLFIGQTTFAQDKKEQRIKKNPEMRAEMRSYVEQEMYPTIKKMHQTFESQLSEADFNFIQEKKRVIEKKKEELRRTKDEMRANGATREEMQAKMKSYREANKANKEVEKAEIKAFMQRNKDLLDNTIGSLKPNYETWIADQKAIVQKYRPQGEEKPELQGADGKKKPKIGLFGLATPRNIGRGGHPHTKGEMNKQQHSSKDQKGQMKDGKKKNRKEGVQRGVALEFVLWNGELPPVKEEKMRKGKGSKKN